MNATMKFTYDSDKNFCIIMRDNKSGDEVGRVWVKGVKNLRKLSKDLEAWAYAEETVAKFVVGELNG